MLSGRIEERFTKWDFIFFLRWVSSSMMHCKTVLYNVKCGQINYHIGHMYLRTGNEAVDRHSDTLEAQQYKTLQDRKRLPSVHLIKLFSPKYFGVFFSHLYFFTIWDFKFWHNMSFWVLSQLEFLTFVTIWFFDFCLNLSLNFLSLQSLLSLLSLLLLSSVKFYSWTLA